jgi:DNA-directed RNA polymerase specialized sigma subunit
MKKQEHYLNNAQFLQAIVEYKKKIANAKKKHEEIPDVDDYIGKCFLSIAENLARKSNFANYTFREDMVSDAVENCLRSIDNFNPAKSKNPFSYFTQIIYFAFLRRIGSEKKQLYAKYKATEQLGLLQDINQANMEEIGQEANSFKVYENITEFIQSYEKSKRMKTRKGKPSPKTMLTNILRFVGDR